MSSTLRRALDRRGARFAPDARDDADPRDFGDPVAELDAALDRAVWSVERPAVVLGNGPDLPELLNRLSTQQVHDLAPGAGAPTVLTSPKGRIVSRLWCHHVVDDGLLLVGGRGAGPTIVGHIGRYTFAERTGLTDVSGEVFAIPIRGPRAADALERSGAPPVQRYATARASLRGADVHVLGHDLLSPDGYTLVVAAADGEAAIDEIDEAVRAVGGRAAGRTATEIHRIARGRPADAGELNEDHNPLEAGLDDAVHPSKGCYVGQEVIARLNTYDKVARRLMVVVPTSPESSAPAPGATIRIDDRPVGQVSSSAARPSGGWLALAYVKRSRAAAGATVRIGEDGRESVDARLEDPPVDPRG